MLASLQSERGLTVGHPSLNHPLIYLSSTHPSIHLSCIHVPTHLPTCPSVQPPMSFHSKSINQSTYPSIYPSTHLSIYPPTHHPSIHPSSHPVIDPCMYLSTYPSIHPMHACKHPSIHASIHLPVSSFAHSSITQVHFHRVITMAPQRTVDPSYGVDSRYHPQ